MKQVSESHVDHNLTELQLLWVLGQSAPDGELCVQTLEFPEDLGTLPCALYGPVMGDAPIPEAHVKYKTRGDRAGQSRMVSGSVRPSRLVTIVSGPHGDNPCVLYTSYGGPKAPREQFEDNGPEASEFWAQHALVD